MKSPRLLAFILTLALAVVAGAGDKRPITPQDLWRMKRLGAPVLSPDGTRAAFSVQEWSIEKNKSTSSLWIVDLAGGEPRRLTTAAASDTAPAWSPDGTQLAFISKRGEDEATGLYLIRLDGGEARKILELPYGVANPQWLPDGKAIVVATTVIPEIAGALGKDDLAAMKKEIKRRRDSKMTAKVTENRQFRYFDHWLTDNLASRLLRLNVETGEFKDLTPKWDRLFQNGGEVNYDVSPDGRMIVLAANSTPPPFATLNVDLYLVPTDGSGTMKDITAENPADDDQPKFTPDGKAVVYAHLKTPYYSGEFAKLWRHDLARGTNTPLTENLDYALDDVEFSPDGKTLWTSAEDKGVVPLFKLNADGSGLTAAYHEGTSTGVQAGAHGVVFLNDTTSRPNELFVLDPATNAVRQLTHFNDALVAQLDLGKVEPYWFVGANGEQIHGWLVLPPGFDPAKKYPLVQLMHGGPHTMNRDSWSYRWNTHVFASPGYVVTWVNRHGSTGFGEKFSQSILNQWGDMPFEDIMKSTDYLLQRFPNLDPQRVAAAGGSYGGYMAAWVEGHTNRFKCIIDHAGVNDFVTQYGADVTNYGFTHVLGGTPWDNPEGMRRNDPMTYAKNFKTPMLIIHGEMDYRVPYVNGTALYGVLQSMGVPSRLLVFPNENHWVLTPQNAIYWHWEMQSWFARYIGGKPSIEKPVFDAEAK
ncbi:MAG TPA: S9 family peptidase [Lacunisphaera sp.]|nr:S9 family peptidase [Lacunisphaera sp.]